MAMADSAGAMETWPLAVCWVKVSDWADRLTAALPEAATLSWVRLRAMAEGLPVTSVTPLDPDAVSVCWVRDSAWVVSVTFELPCPTTESCVIVRAMGPMMDSMSSPARLEFLQAGSCPAPDLSLMSVGFGLTLMYQGVFAVCALLTESSRDSVTMSTRGMQAPKSFSARSVPLWVSSL